MFDAIYVEASEPGEILCLDCFYVGKLEGVGNVWQITACDAASSFGWARVFIGDPRATVAVILLRLYAHERAHRGYRTRGRTPASIVVGADEG